MDALQNEYFKLNKVRNTIHELAGGQRFNGHFHVPILPYIDAKEIIMSD